MAPNRKNIRETNVDQDLVFSTKSFLELFGIQQQSKNNNSSLLNRDELSKAEWGRSMLLHFIGNHGGGA